MIGYASSLNTVATVTLKLHPERSLLPDMSTFETQGELESPGAVLRLHFLLRSNHFSPGTPRHDSSARQPIRLCTK
jgi:hypothetical protein